MAAPGGVWLDAQGAQTPGNIGRGICRYILEQTRAILELAPETVSGVVVRPDRPLHEVLGELPPELTHRVGDPPPPRAEAPALYHAMSPFELSRTLAQVWPPWARAPETALVVTLYDLIPLLYGDPYLRDPVERLNYMTRLRILGAADHVVALSELSRADAVARLGVDAERISVIEAGITALADAPATREEAATTVAESFPGFPERFVLYVGGADHRKNLPRLVEAYGLLEQRLRRQVRLVIVCSVDDFWTDLVRDAARDAGVAEDELILTGYVSDRELAALYMLCELFAFPSLYEGFGLPIVEAMSFGAPVVAGRTPVNLEVLGDEEAAFDPLDPAAIADALRGALTVPGELDRLRARSERRAGRFTWERVAELTVGAYEQALAKPRRADRRPRRPRIALVTPWPPQGSGIAAYNRRLAASLARLADTEVVVAGSPAEFDRSVEPEAMLVSSRQHRWLRDLHRHDRIVYCMGNSLQHLHVREALLERPGAVVAHDVRLTGLYYPLAEEVLGDNPDYVRRILSMYGERVPEEVAWRALPWSEEEREFGIHMSREVQEHAELMLVHSAEAAKLLRGEPVGEGLRPEVRTVPFGVPEPAFAGYGSRNGAGPRILVSGAISQAKPLELAVGALARLPAELGARLAISGFDPSRPPERLRMESLAELAAERGVAERVDLIPRAGDAAYWAELRCADLALQLRTVSNGEASAAVSDAIAAGVPLLVSDLGWYGELPPAVAGRVPADADEAEVAAALEAMLADPARLGQMRKAERELAAERSFDRVAGAYLEALGL